MHLLREDFSTLPEWDHTQKPEPEDARVSRAHVRSRTLLFGGLPPSGGFGSGRQQDERVARRPRGGPSVSAKAARRKGEGAGGGRDGLQGKGQGSGCRFRG